ncbi:MAG: hypothetical protein KDJ65_05020 [Anaerolineae bacterium]|nr:hypothetical protein [Anaerolineae bacterium]
MKYLGTILAVGLTMFVIVTVGVFSFLPTEAEPAAAESIPEPLPVPSLPASFEPNRLKTELTGRETLYQTQIADLDQTLQERQSIYHHQIQDMSSQLATAQNQLSQLQAQAETLSQQTHELQTLHDSRVATYQDELTKAQTVYATRFTEIQQAIADAQARLAEANARLGR